MLPSPARNRQPLRLHSLSLSGADNPSSRNHLFRFSSAMRSNPIPYKTEKRDVIRTDFSPPTAPFLIGYNAPLWPGRLLLS